MRTGSKVETMLQNLEDMSDHLRGPTAIYNLKQEALGMTGHRASLLSDLVLHPKVTTLEHLHTRMEQWEAHHRELTLSGAKMPECALVSGLKCMMPPSMAKWVRENPDKCTKLEELKYYIKATISLQREHFFAGGISNTAAPPLRSSAAPKDKDGDVPMPLANQVQTEGISMPRGEEDMGEHFSDGEDQDALGVWKINGACRGCGVWGHMQRDCAAFHKGGGKKGDSKGKGKGDKGKGKGKTGSHAYAPYPQQDWNYNPGWNAFSGPVKGGKKGFGKGHGGGGKGYGYAVTSENVITGWGSPYCPPAVNGQSYSLTTVQPVRVSNRYENLEVTDEDYPDLDSSVKFSEKLERVHMPKRTFMTQSKAKKLWKQQMKTIKEDREWVTAGNQEPAFVPISDLNSSGYAEANQVPKATSELNYLSCDQDTAYSINQDGGQFLETVMDSGATSSVISAKDVVKYPPQESVGSRAGQVFLSASGGRMKNEGEKYMPIITEEGHRFGMTYQVAPVSKGLTSVGEMCDEGNGDNFVVFHKGGGYIACPGAGTVTAFERSAKNGAYLLRVWVPDPVSDRDFARQG